MNKAEIKKKLNSKITHYYESGFWNFVNEFTPFGIKLYNGKTVFVAIYSFEPFLQGSFFIFEDMKKFATYENIFDFTRKPNLLRMSEKYLSQDGLAVMLDENQNMPVDLGMKPAKYSIFRFKPHIPPEKTDKKSDLELVLEVLEKVMVLNFTLNLPLGEKILESLKPVIEGRGIIPIFDISRNKSKLTVEKLVLNIKPKYYKKLKFNNELLISKLNRTMHIGTWAVEYFYPSTAFKLDQKDSEYGFINGLIIVDLDYEYMEPILIEEDAFKNPEEFLNKVAQELLNFEKLPQKVLVQDKRTRNVLNDFFSKIGIQVEVKDEIEELDRAENEIFDFENNELMPESDMETLSKIDDILGDLSEVDSPYSKRMLDHLQELRKNIMESNDFGQDLTFDNLPEKTINFGYRDSEGNRCIIEASNQTNLSVILAKVLNRVSKDDYFTEEELDLLLEMAGYDDKLLDPRKGQKIDLFIVDQNLSVTLEVNKVLPKTTEIIRIFELEPNKNK